MLLTLKKDAERYALALTLKSEAHSFDAVGLVVSGCNEIFQDGYDTNSSISQKHFGEKLRGLLRSDEYSPQDVQQVALIFLCICTERTLRTGVHNGYDIKIEKHFRKFLGKGEDSTDDYTVEFAYFTLPHLVLRDEAQKSLGKLSEIQRSVEETSEKIVTRKSEFSDMSGKIEKWTSNFTKWTSEIDGYSKEINRITHDYNFAGLAKAFDTLRSNKEGQLIYEGGATFFLGLLLILVIVSQLFPSNAYLGIIAVSWDINNWFKALPVIALEVVILYFFRIALRNWLHTKDVVLDLQFRHSICAFIQSYATFMQDAASQKHGENTAAVSRLEKFEAMVFNPIQKSLPDVPKTLDMLDSIADITKFLKADKGK